MSESDHSLRRWAHRRSTNLDKATLGQLVALLELSGSDSVAALCKGSAPSAATSAGVNYRQKLARLERALGLGRLTKRNGKVTRPTDVGMRLAGEIRLFLQELQVLESHKPETPTWKIGAGDAWLAGVIIPALTSMAESFPNWRWEISNLRTREIRSGLLDGEIHFGLLRHDESFPARFTTGTRLEIARYRVVVGQATGSFATPRDLVLWAIKEGRPFVQQGSTWDEVSRRAGAALGLKRELGKLSLQVVCESHPQALAAAQSGSSWCIVPAPLGGVSNTPVRSAVFSVASAPETLALANYGRSLQKYADADRVWTELNRRVRAAFHETISTVVRNR
jgi:DNA-binding transcriptional LysR family regulator